MSTVVVAGSNTSTPYRPAPAYAAAHGGLWRTAYTPRSALSLAALLGYAAARKSLPDRPVRQVRIHRDQ